nr:oligosaccharide flippase family protein [Ardenticatena sp.]
MPSNQSDQSIGKQAIRGSFYSLIASGATISLGFLRAVLLARLLLPEHFGVATLALFFLNLATTLTTLGLDSAIIHRQDADDTWIDIYFTLRVLANLVPLALLAILTPLIGRAYPDMPTLPLVLWAFIAIEAVRSLNAAQETMLNRALAFRTLALLDIISSVAMTICAPLAAWWGAGIWALVLERAVGHAMRALGVWWVFRAYQPRLRWDGAKVRWFFRFSRSVWLSSNLTFLLDRFDDFWTGTFLGQTALGYYSKAYEFARYPRRLIANPIVSVFYPIFARLQDDPIRLARAFFRMNSAMVRFGFWFGLLFVFGAEELVRLFIGERWLPMVPTFQLMILYVILDPLVVGSNRLLLAVGRPELVTRVRLVQFLCFAPLVLLLGRRLGIEGVALAADVMVAVGLLLLFIFTRRIIAYSPWVLFFWPTIAALGASVLIWTSGAWWPAAPPLMSLVRKALLGTCAYGLILWIAERHELLEALRIIKRRGWNA